MIAKSIILNFQTESCCDSLTIYDGSSTSASQITKLSGNKGSFSISSSGNNLYLKWRSDGSVTAKGFSAIAYYKILNPSEPIYETCCIFPFVHENVQHNQCIDNGHSTYWCATKTNSNGTYTKWKNCDKNCSKFPSIHKIIVFWNYIAWDIFRIN